MSIKSSERSNNKAKITKKAGGCVVSGGGRALYCKHMTHISNSYILYTYILVLFKELAKVQLLVVSKL